MGVRFLAINDGYDNFSNSFSDDLIMHLLNITNDVYAKDISAKISPVLFAKQLKGEFIGPFPPYGYLRQKNDASKLEPDPNTAPIVEQIFKLKSEGCSYISILKWLSKENIPSPSAYRMSIGLCKSKKFENSLWTTTVVKRILKNRTYLGHTLSGKYKCSLADGIPRHNVPKEEWIVVENTHEAITSKELFEEAEAVMIKRANSYNEMISRHAHIPKEETLFPKMVYCGACGTMLVKTRQLTQKADGTEGHYNFYTHRRLTYTPKEDRCTWERVQERKILEVMKNSLKEIAAFSQKTIEEEANYRKIQTKVNSLKTFQKNQELSKKLSKVTKLKNTALEYYIENKLSKSDFEFMMTEYNHEIEKFTQEISANKLEIPADHTDDQYLIQEFLSDSFEPTRNKVEKLVSKIIVHDLTNIEIQFHENIRVLAEKLNFSKGEGLEL